MLDEMELRAADKETLLAELDRYGQMLSVVELRSLFPVIKEIIDGRESKASCCPYCQSGYIVRNGRRHGKQAYLCRTCGKSFVSTVGTLQYWSHHPKADWAKAIESTVKGEFLTELSDKLQVSHTTAFNMRHKVLRAMEMEANAATEQSESSVSDDSGNSETAEKSPAEVPASEPAAFVTYAEEDLPFVAPNPAIGCLLLPAYEAPLALPSGEMDASQPTPEIMAATPERQQIEASSAPNPSQKKNTSKSTAVLELDETYVLDDFKGKKLPKGFYRKPRAHGAKAMLPGLSWEYVCICTAVEREGGTYAKTVNRAKPSNEELMEVFGDQLKEGSLILCDGLMGYENLAEETGCVVRNGNKAPKKEVNLFNLNKVNNFPSEIKDKHRQYCGVATKYQNRYNILYSIAHNLDKDELKEMTDHLLTHSGIPHNSTIKEVYTKGLLLPLGDPEMCVWG